MMDFVPGVFGFHRRCGTSFVIVGCLCHFVLVLVYGRADTLAREPQHKNNGRPPALAA